MKYWLMKSEADSYSIDDLKRDKKTAWTGVRNYQARNFMTQQMQVGDAVIFYHSNSNPTGAVGRAEVCALAHADSSAFDKKSEFYEPKATPENPIWSCVDIAYKEKFKKAVTLEEIRAEKKLAELMILRRGNRLSITPLSAAEFKKICELGGSDKG